MVDYGGRWKSGSNIVKQLFSVGVLLFSLEKCPAFFNIHARFFEARVTKCHNKKMYQSQPAPSFREGI